MINDQFFRNAFRDRKLTIRGVAAKLGMKHHSQLSLMLKGDRRMQLDEAINLAQILGVPLNTIIANAGYPTVLQEGRRIPVVGILRGKGEIEPVPEHTERAIAPVGEPDVVSAIQARTAETPLSWADRWVFFCRERTEPENAADGQLCQVQIKGGPCVLASVRRGYSPGSYRLSGPYLDENAKVDWVAPVILTRN